MQPDKVVFFLPLLRKIAQVFSMSHCLRPRAGAQTGVLCEEIVLVAATAAPDKLDTGVPVVVISYKLCSATSRVLIQNFI